MIYSASSDLLIINNLDPASYLKRQLFWVLFSFVIGMFIFRLKISVLKSRRVIQTLLLALLLMLSYLILLKVVKGDSAAVNGAVGWINFGPVNIQPVEFGKLILILYLAFILNNRDGRIVKGNIITELFAPGLIAGLIILMVFIQPDLGGAAILFVITLVMFSMSGMPAKTAIGMILFIVAVIVGGVALLIKWNPSFLAHQYQFQRLISFIDPFGLEKTGGAQLANSYYAIHNGGLFGVGLGNSIQKRGYLPEPYTDFILSVIAEELGVIVAIALLGVIFYLIWRITMVGLKSKSTFNSLVCYGVATMIFIQTFFNVGAVLGIIPITGVTLPFISYGGSSYMVLTFSIAIVLNISTNERRSAEVESSQQQSTN